VEDGYSWRLGESQNKLASDRSGAFAAFGSLDPVLRQDLEKGSQGTLAPQRADRPGRAKLAAELRAHGDRLKGDYARAVAEQKDAERQFLAEERVVVEALVAELEAARPAGS